jgi:hypothetical protein
MFAVEGEKCMMLERENGKSNREREKRPDQVADM